MCIGQVVSQPQIGRNVYKFALWIYENNSARDAYKVKIKYMNCNIKYAYKKYCIMCHKIHALFLPAGLLILACGELGGVSALGMGPGETGEGADDSVSTSMRQKITLFSC